MWQQVIGFDSTHFKKEIDIQCIHIVITYMVEVQANCNLLKSHDVQLQWKGKPTQEYLILNYIFSLSLSLILQEFEDLDEIIARHIQPMAALVRDVTSHKYYRDVEGGSKELMDKCLAAEKKKTPNRIPYFMCLCKDYPGKRKNSWG